MKLIHLSDLHIGKNVNKFPMLDEQKYILRLVLDGIREEKPDAILISGDVYDKSTPSLEAVKLLDWFLTTLAEEKQNVILISGNHDSPERLSFCSELIEKSGVHIKSIFDGDLTPVVLHDEYGAVNFYCVPFIRITDVNNIYGTDFTDYSEAFSYVVEKMNLDPMERNIILSHQYVAGASFSESESTIGGVDYISKEVYAPFDYAALGHIHKAQGFNEQRIRYCGTLLKYSVKEVGQKKTYTIVTLGEKTTEKELCSIDVRNVEITPRHDMVSIKKSYNELISAELNEDGIVSEDYTYITLTDEEYIDDAAGTLRKLYPNLMNVSYDRNEKETDVSILDAGEGIGERSPFELFSEFFEKQRSNEMDEQQKEILRSAIKDVWGE